MDVDFQISGSDCSLHAVATAYKLCAGNNPTGITSFEVLLTIIYNNNNEQTLIISVCLLQSCLFTVSQASLSKGVSEVDHLPM